MTWTRIHFNEKDGMNMYIYACPRDELDLDKLRRNKGRVAYAIPSPGRGENPRDWAVTHVPVLNQ